MKHQLKEGMAAKCANAHEMRSAINAIKAGGVCPIWSTTICGMSNDSSFDFIILHNGEVCRGSSMWSAAKWITLHEFILRALGQWVEEPKELTLETAKELLGKCAGVMAASKKRIEGEGRTTFELDLVFDKLAEYGIKP